MSSLWTCLLESAPRKCRYLVSPPVAANRVAPAKNDLVDSAASELEDENGTRGRFVGPVTESGMTQDLQRRRVLPLKGPRSVGVPDVCPRGPDSHTSVRLSAPREMKLGQRERSSVGAPEASPAARSSVADSRVCDGVGPQDDFRSPDRNAPSSMQLLRRHPRPHAIDGIGGDPTGDVVPTGRSCAAAAAGSQDRRHTNHSHDQMTRHPGNALTLTGSRHRS